MSGTINGLMGKLLLKGYHSEIEEIYKKLSNNYKNNFLYKIQRHNDLNEKSFEKFNSVSYKLDIPIIASHEVFYIDQSMHDLAEALICIREKTYVNKDRSSYSDQHYLKPDNEMKTLFQKIYPGGTIK